MTRWRAIHCLIRSRRRGCAHYLACLAFGYGLNERKSSHQKGITRLLDAARTSKVSTRLDFNIRRH
jgi:hypothetical protein